MAEKVTQKEYIERLKEKYGDKLDFSKTVYGGAYSKVVAICPKHGEFTKIARELYSGGCPKCSSNFKQTTETFIKKAKEKWGDKYSYDNVVYIDCKKHVLITCKTHGDFPITPDNFIRGKECPKCKGTYKRTKDEFVEEANKIWGDKFDFSESNYTRMNSSIIARCVEHGYFKTLPVQVLKGVCSCKKCTKIKAIETNTTPFREIVEKAKYIHGDRFEYIESSYINVNKKMDIKCLKHGIIFKQTPIGHFKSKNPCPICNGHMKSNTEEFAKKARKIHGDKYDYSVVEYKNCDTVVDIICPQHGVFKQSPFNHLSGNGCPECVGRYKSTESFLNDVILFRGHEYDYSRVKYTGYYDYVTIGCKTHGWVEVKARSLLTKTWNVCPRCRSFKLEDVILKYLTTNGIEFKREHSFGKGIGQKRVDFYLPKYNAVIECQGIQHFEPISWFGGQKGFKKCLNSDRIKREYCENNGINIFYYSELGIDYPYNVYEDVDLMFEEIKKGE